MFVPIRNATITTGEIRCGAIDCDSGYRFDADIKYKNCPICGSDDMHDGELFCRECIHILSLVVKDKKEELADKFLNHIGIHAMNDLDQFLME